MVFPLSTRGRKSKYGAVPTIVDNIRFASKAEARHYQALKLLERAGEITELKLQPRFPLKIGDMLIATYVADFSFLDNKSGGLVVHDVKGVRTPVFIIKAKLLEALYGIKVTEIK